MRVLLVGLFLGASGCGLFPDLSSLSACGTGCVGGAGGGSAGGASAGAGGASAGAGAAGANSNAGAAGASTNAGAAGANATAGAAGATAGAGGQDGGAAGTSAGFGGSAPAGSSGAAGTTGTNCPGGNGVASPASVHVVLGGADFCIDATEVTYSQYEDFLLKHTGEPGSEHPACGFNTEYVPTSTETSRNYVWENYLANKDELKDHPVRGVDWCDAYAYCAAAGKWLCGAPGKGGGKVADTDVGNPDKDAWFLTCSSRGTELFPYGGAYDQSKCNTPETHDETQVDDLVAPVASFSGCVSFVPVYDLSGNVSEYEDNCASDGATPNLDTCQVRGGTFYTSMNEVECVSTFYTRRDGLNVGDEQDVPGIWFGLRCCGPDPI